MFKYGYIRFTVHTMFFQAVDFYVCIKNSYNSDMLHRDIGKRYGKRVEESLLSSDEYGASTLCLDGDGDAHRYLVIVYPHADKVSLNEAVSHEIAHVCTNIYEVIGCNKSSYSDEPFAYLTGYITRVFYENYYRLTSRKRK